MNPGYSPSEPRTSSDMSSVPVRSLSRSAHGACGTPYDVHRLKPLPLFKYHGSVAPGGDDLDSKETMAEEKITAVRMGPEVTDVEDKISGPVPGIVEPQETLNEKVIQQEPELAQRQPDEYTGHHHYVLKRLRRRLPPLSSRRKLAIRWAISLSVLTAVSRCAYR